MSARHRKHKLKIRGAEQEVRRLERLSEAFDAVVGDMRDLGWPGASVAMHTMLMRQVEILAEAKRMRQVVVDLERSMPK